MPPPRQDTIIKRVYGVHNILRYYESKAVESVKKILCSTQCGGWSGTLPPSDTECHLLLQSGEGINNSNLIKSENQRSPQPYPIGDGVSRHSELSAERIQLVQNNRNGRNASHIYTYKIMLNILPLSGKDYRMGNNPYPPLPSLIREGVISHPELVSASHQMLQPACSGSDECYNYLKNSYKTQVVGAAATPPKRTYSPIHLFSYSLQKKSAFTLAEVLITLGIIGVVAAMTMPALINKYQTQVLRTQFLQANSILQDGISRMRFDEVDLNEVINKRNSAIIAQYFENGHCTLPKDEYEAGYYNFYGTKLAADAAASDLVQPYCLKNGMILWFGKLRQMGPDGGSSWSDDDRYSLLAMDINGWKKKPDRYGHDVFFWYLDPDTNMVKPVGDYGDFPTSFYYTTCPGDRENSSEAGIGCTAKALSDPEYFKKIGLSK